MCLTRPTPCLNDSRYTARHWAVPRDSPIATLECPSCNASAITTATPPGIFIRWGNILWSWHLMYVQSDLGRGSRQGGGQKLPSRYLLEVWIDKLSCMKTSLEVYLNIRKDIRKDISKDISRKDTCQVLLPGSIDISTWMQITSAAKRHSPPFFPVPMAILHLHVVVGALVSFLLSTYECLSHSLEFMDRHYLLFNSRFCMRVIIAIERLPFNQVEKFLFQHLSGVMLASPLLTITLDEAV